LRQHVNAQCRKAFEHQDAKIQSKNAKPMTMADIDKTMPMKLARLRLA
jgi:hypothetical protein